MPETNVTQPSDDQLDALICEYLEAAERGRPPAEEDFIAQHPAFAEQLREFFSDWGGIPDPASKGSTAETQDTQHDDSDPAQGKVARQLELEDFELVREIGRGGMGQVFEARQRSLRRVVAVKAMAAGKTSARHGRHGGKAAERNTQELRGRFLREAEVTGGLQHPGIVPVYAVGSAADGEPYYAMRLIEGESLHDAIERFHASLNLGEDFPRTRALEFRRLLRRLIDVCNAIDYAHSQQVIHRDIKPRNVMLGRFGETLVVDWGLAKLTAPGTSLVDTSPLPVSQPISGTHQGSAVGTPAFMSPEQASGELERLGPASDVYSLGATLYCLLTGKQAFEGRDLLAIFDRVKRGDFPKPRAVCPHVPAALEAICLKAMALEKSGRYATATLLADDLERWLADEPVSAYREPFLERCARWGRRHRTWIRAGMLGLAVVSALAALSAWMIDRERQATELHRKQALARLNQSRGLTDALLTGVSESLALHPNAQGTRKYLLERAAAEYEQFVQQSEDDPELELERGRSYLRLGEVRHLLREQKTAGEAFQIGQEIFDRLRDAQPTWGQARMEAANSRTQRGLLLSEANQPAEAVALYLEAIALADGLLAESPENAGYREAWATATLNHAARLARDGDSKTAIESLEGAIARLQGWAHDPSADAKTARLAVRGQMTLAKIFLDDGNFDAAYAPLTEASTFLDAMVAKEPGIATYRNDRATVRVLLAQVAGGLGHADTERSSYESARLDFDELSTTFPDVPMYSENRALTDVDLAQCWLQLGDAKEAEKVVGPAVDAFAELALTPDYASYIEALASAQDVLGQAHLELGELELAADACTAAIQQLNQLLKGGSTPNYRYRRALALAHLAQAKLRMGGNEDIAAAQESSATATSELTALWQSGDRTADYRLALAEHLDRFGGLLIEAQMVEQGKETLGQASTHWREMALDEKATVEQLERAARFFAECVDPALHDRKLAMELAGKAYQRAPENESLMTTLAGTQFRAGESREKSARLLQAAIKQRPHARAYFYLAMQHAPADAEAATKSFAEGVEWLKTHAPGSREFQRLRDEAGAKLGIAQ